jgi:hypothetical protein
VSCIEDIFFENTGYPVDEALLNYNWDRYSSWEGRFVQNIQDLCHNGTHHLYPKYLFFYLF